MALYLILDKNQQTVAVFLSGIPARKYCLKHIADSTSPCSYTVLEYCMKSMSMMSEDAKIVFSINVDIIGEIIIETDKILHV